VIGLPKGAAERRITLGPQFAETFQIDDVQPQPAAVEAGPPGQILRFRISDGGPAEIVVHITPLRTGLARYRTSVDGAAPDDLTTFVLP
jgi:hypothetical protein